MKLRVNSCVRKKTLYIEWCSHYGRVFHACLDIVPLDRDGYVVLKVNKF